MISRAEPVMGTVFSFLVDPITLPTDEVQTVIELACKELHQLDNRFSLWKQDSELSQWRLGAIEEPSKLMDEVFQLCAHACHITKGFFDPWAMPGGFDPTGLVKGWAAQRALSILEEGGIEAGLINAGGDICVLPGKTYQIGIQHPNEKDCLCAVIPTDTSIATSGIYERGNHLIHPFGRDIASVSATVVGGQLAITDALATALAVGGKEVLYLLEQLEGIEGFFITPTGSLFKTSGLEFSKSLDEIN